EVQRSLADLGRLRTGQPFPYRQHGQFAELRQPARCLFASGEVFAVQVGEHAIEVGIRRSGGGRLQFTPHQRRGQVRRGGQVGHRGEGGGGVVAGQRRPQPVRAGRG